MNILTLNERDEIRFLWRTDVHLSDKSPVSRVDDWTTTVLDKLDQIRVIAKEQKINAVLDGGDFFHLKSPSRNSHDLVRRVIDLHKEYPCPVFCTPGNHDCVFGDYANLPKQPLGVLYSTGVFKRLYDEHEVTYLSNGFKVRVVGIPYHGVSYDMDRFHRIKKEDEDYLVVVAHVLASKNRGTMFEKEDIISYSELKDHPADVFLFGHWHKDQGIHEEWGKKFVNIGSLTRGALSEDGMYRKPSIAILTFTKEGFEVVQQPLNVKAAEDVFDIQKRMQVEERTSTINRFVDSIQKTLSPESVAPLKGVVQSLDIPHQVRERMLYYIEGAE